MRSIHAMILYVGILNVWRHVSGKIASGVAVRGDGGVGVPKFHSWGKCTMPLTNIKPYRLDVQRFLWPVYYILRGPFKLHLGV